jgi:glyoxylase-like metal-dependent hydrolase (beta-lactamase superfamily II)
MLEVIPLPALRDNYIWLIHDGQYVVAVDPGEAGPILSWLAARHMRLAAILVTHHHADHVGGVAELVAAYACPVYAPATLDLGLNTRPVADGGQIVLEPPALRLSVLAVPGHTRDHLAYLGHGHLFCGDTLFSCGCGRLFEGTAEQMLRAVRDLAPTIDVFVFAAAVSDFRVESPPTHKIKRTGNSLTLPLIENPDIAQAIGCIKERGQITVGFAAETEDLERNALAKLERKRLDLIVANNVSNPRIGFDRDVNEVTIYGRDGSRRHISERPKSDVAFEVFEAVLGLLGPRQPSPPATA